MTHERGGKMSGATIRYTIISSQYKPAHGLRLDLKIRGFFSINFRRRRESM